MRDRWALVLAVAVVVGAMRPQPLPLVPVAVGVVAACVGRRPALLCVGAMLLAGVLAHRSMAGLEGVEPGPVDRSVTLLTDPAEAGGRVRAEVRLGRRRVQLQASQAVAGDLVLRLAGERLHIRGELAPFGRPTRWAVSRHLAGRLTVEQWSDAGAADRFSAMANALRRRLADGASGLGARRTSLFAGLVVGDDRSQPVDLTDDFRGAGLTHLLAVSGQNVAFVLALGRPLATRLRLWPRLGVTVAAIAGFALLTRFEPSVNRAAVMAVLSATTMAIGRPVSRLRIVALGVAGLVLVDPLLVWSLGFRLSVAASLAIVTAASPLARVLPGPRWLADPLAVTAAAQLGVAPFLLSAFGPLPLASVPANLLAVPAAGAVMMWGMTAGVVAGWAPAPVAELLHQPTGGLLWWIEGVAERSARAPLGTLGPAGVAAVAGGLAALIVAARARRPGLRRLALVVVSAVVYLSVVAAHAAPALRERLAPGVVRWHRGSTDVVVLGGGSWRDRLDAETVLGVLRGAGVRDIELLVAVDPSVDAALIDAVRDRHPTGRILVPLDPDLRRHLPTAVPIPSSGGSVTVGALIVTITPGADRLVVEATPRPRLRLSTDRGRGATR